MKKLLVFAAVALTVASSDRAFAQTSNTATAVTTAEILTILSIENDTALNFGKLAPDSAGSTAGTVVISTGGARSKTGPLLLIAGSPYDEAQFTVTGDNAATFAVAVDSANITLTGVPGGTMEVGTFTKSCAAGCTISEGSAIITIGGTLTVSATQAKGVYTNAAGLSVTVVYE